ncbi:MAG: Hsp70 family protein [Candidatus Auribacterota bacterium]|nr:Hsp70 family protein [Candidatus Auribacterota bacterium]
MTEQVIGIDLGTTNSEVAVIKDGIVSIVEIDGSKIMPSYVALNQDGKLVVGIEARNQYVLYPQRTIRSIKRKMGTDEKVKLGDREYFPQEISAMIIKKLKLAAEEFLGEVVHKAVITVPAQFSDSQRQATRDAGKMAGLEVARIINEPTAATMAYENESNEKQKILAFDLGGGTFDVSIVEAEDDVMEVISSHGDNHLGGDDIDTLIADRMIRTIYTGQEKSSSLTPSSLHRLEVAAETAKLRLSDYPHALISEDNLSTESGERGSIEITVDRTELEKKIKPLMDKMLSAVYQALADAGLNASDLDEIILVGGATRTPMIRDVLEEELGRRPRQDIHPDLAVVYGAGVMAARLMGQYDQRVLVDITPYTFGTSSLGWVNKIYGPHLFVPIIKAGTPLPASHAESFFTVFDEQQAVDVTIFQGEDRDARNNILIGKFLIEDLASVPAGNEIILKMDLDLDGILRVSAVESKTNLSKEVSITEALAILTTEQLSYSKKMINEMFGLGDSDNEAIPIVEAEREEDGLQGETKDNLAARVNLNIPKMDEVDREEAKEWLAKLERATEAEDAEEIERISTKIEDLLFYLNI